MTHNQLLALLQNTTDSNHDTQSLIEIRRREQAERELQPQEDESTYHDWENDVIEYDQQEEY